LENTLFWAEKQVRNWWGPFYLFGGQSSYPHEKFRPEALNTATAMSLGT